MGGIAFEAFTRLLHAGAAEERVNSDFGPGAGIAYEAPILKVVWDQLLAEAGVKVLLHSRVVAARKNSQRRISGVQVITNGPRLEISGEVFIDTSGDAFLAYNAGAAFEGGDGNSKVQALTTTFRLANVDKSRLQEMPPPKLHQLMQELRDAGEYRLHRVDGNVHPTPFLGMVGTNMVRIHVDDPTDPLQLSAAEVAGRREALEYIRFLTERVPGFAEAVLVDFSHHIGVRETRRIVGEYRLTTGHIKKQLIPDSTITLCGAPVEIHGDGDRAHYEHHRGVYGIPFECLVPRGLDNLLVAGRCFSASHRAHASARSIAQCMAMGEAAGIAAALSSSSENFRVVDVRLVRKALLEAGAILQFSETA